MLPLLLLLILLELLPVSLLVVSALVVGLLLLLLLILRLLLLLLLLPLLLLLRLLRVNNANTATVVFYSGRCLPWATACGGSVLAVQAIENLAPRPLASSAMHLAMPVWRWC